MAKNNNLAPEIIKDRRGEIRRYTVGKTKFNVLISRKGTMRGGDFHLNTQFNLLLKGKLEITLRQNDKNKKCLKNANELIEIPPNIPHIFKSLTNTIMLEWWNSKFSVQYYPPFRSLITKQFRKLK